MREDFLLNMLPKQAVCVEIGVHLGEFSQAILDITNPKKLYLIDPWQNETSKLYNNTWYGNVGQQEMDSRYQKVCLRFSKEIDSGQIVICKNFSIKVLSFMKDNTLDWVYIDGNHMYDFVKIDLEIALAKIKPGGYITGDDYREPKNPLQDDPWDGGVKKAVQEFIAKHTNIKMIQIKNYQFILRKINI